VAIEQPLEGSTLSHQCIQYNVLERSFWFISVQEALASALIFKVNCIQIVYSIIVRICQMLKRKHASLKEKISII
jgi:hypothetical protein